MTAPTPVRPIICARFAPAELDLLEIGCEALGVATLAQFVHQAAVALGRGFAAGAIEVVRVEAA